MIYYKRALEQNIIDTLKNFPCVYIDGPRQVGKSTLVKHIAKKYFEADYINFDDPFILAAAKESPVEFLNGYKGSIILDEVQMVPELSRLLKKRIDEMREQNLKHKIILTGSSDIMAVPELSKALVGRMVIFRMYPFSSIEIAGNKGNFIKNIWNNDFSNKRLESEISINEMITRATFPEVSLLNNLKASKYRDWFSSYIRTILDRDVKEISDIQKLDALPRLLQILAGRTGALLNDSNISMILGLDNMTSKRYRILMEKVFLIRRIKPWLVNIKKRVVKSPKLFFIDTMLLLSVLNTDIYKLSKENKNLYGHIVENFVGMELLKQLTFLSGNREDDIYHYRAGKDEVDFVIEKNINEIVGIEVKAKTSIDFNKDTRGLKALQLASGDKFQKGIILYAGDMIQNLGSNIWAVPINALWETEK